MSKGIAFIKRYFSDKLGVILDEMFFHKAKMFN